MDTDLSLEFLRVVEQAAIACAHTMGLGDRHKADAAAVHTMRRELDVVPIDGTIVIGEGERDEAPMLYIGEKVGMGAHQKLPFGIEFPAVDIAVDPLEGTNLCATGAPNAIAVLAASSSLRHPSGTTCVRLRRRSAATSTTSWLPCWIARATRR